MKKFSLSCLFFVAISFIVSIQNANAVTCSACYVVVDCPDTWCAVTFTDSGALIECSNGTMTVVHGCGGEQDS